MTKPTENQSTSTSSHTAPTGTLATNGLSDEEKLIAHVTDRTTLVYEHVTAVRDRAAEVHLDLKQHIAICINTAVTEITNRVCEQLTRTKQEVCDRVTDCMPTTQGKLLDEHFKAEISRCNQLVGIAQRAVNGASDTVASLQKTCGCDRAVEY